MTDFLAPVLCLFEGVKIPFSAGDAIVLSSGAGSTTDAFAGFTEACLPEFACVSASRRGGLLCLPLDLGCGVVSFSSPESSSPSCATVSSSKCPLTLVSADPTPPLGRPAVFGFLLVLEGVSGVSEISASLVPSASPDLRLLFAVDLLWRVAVDVLDEVRFFFSKLCLSGYASGICVEFGDLSSRIVFSRPDTDCSSGAPPSVVSSARIVLWFPYRVVLLRFDARGDGSKSEDIAHINEKFVLPQAWPASMASQLCK